MSIEETALDPELAAIHTVFGALKPLEPDSRERVVSYVVARLEISPGASGRASAAPVEEDQVNEHLPELADRKSFETLAELFDAAGKPDKHPVKALVAGYWVQVCEGADSFESLSANKALKDLGYGIPNITQAITGLKDRNPAFVIQLKKSGTSKQARKTYKVTKAGIEAVEEMIDGPG